MNVQLLELKLGVLWDTSSVIVVPRSTRQRRPDRSSEEGTGVPTDLVDGKEQGPGHEDPVLKDGVGA